MCLQVGGLGQAAQAQIVEVLVGGNRDKHLAGKVKDLLIKEVGIVAGMMNPVTRTVTPGTTITSKTTGNCSFLFSLKKYIYIYLSIYLFI